ncbi:MAG: lysophospholipid acyltransferase family protein [Acidobacteriaceae bacterium]|nr:lysophospholipid acyltransferase family protein [Acidobacteriaceae bacterium]
MTATSCWGAAGLRSARRNRLEYWLVRVILVTVSRGPTRFLGGIYAKLLDLCVPKLRRVARRNCELTGMDPRVIDGVFRSIGRMLVCFARFPRINRENVGDWIRYEGFEHYAAAKAKGKGVLFATLHLGNWELSAYAHALLTEPMHIVVRPLDNPLLDALVRARRMATGNIVIGKTDGIRPIYRALAANQAVGILVDQNVGLDDGLFVNFFGKKACVSPAFAKLAARTGTTVIPGYAVWSEAERKYILRFDPPVEITGNTLIDTQRIQNALERAIRAYPDQWLWIHRRWKTRPWGEPPLYGE